MLTCIRVGKCGFNGDGCLTVEATLKNPNCPGCGSSTDLTLIPPHKFNIKTGFRYINGCNGQGATCTGPRCGTKNAFFKTDDYTAQRQCETNNVSLTLCSYAVRAVTLTNFGIQVGLEIIFC